MDTHDFVYLIPGNWFELRTINKSKTQPYDMQMLQDEVLNQVVTRSEKLSVINVAYAQTYSSANIEDINIELTSERFGRIAEFLETESRHPIVTFHGTTKSNVVDSILSGGYIIPGKENGKGIRAIHGTAYGSGVYSTPHLDKALHYTQRDTESYVYVLINLVMMGSAVLLPPTAHKSADSNIDTKIVHGLDQLISTDSSRIIPIGVMKIKVSRK